MSEDFLAGLNEAPNPAFARALRERLRALEVVPARRRAGWRLSFSTAILTASLLIVGSLAFPQVRATAQMILDLFRHRTVAQVRFDPARVEPLRAQLAGRSPVLLLFGAPQALEPSAPVTTYASLDAASTATGLSLLTPAWLPDGMSLDVVHSTGAARTRVTIERDRLQETFDRLDLQKVRVPRGLAEGEFEMHRPLMVSLEYRGVSGNLRLLQGSRPELELRHDFDLALSGEIGLRVLGVGADDAHRLSTTIDWPATLAVPIPAGASEFREVPVRGEKGLLIVGRADGSRPPSPEQVLLWTESGRLYALTGTLGEGVMMRVAGSLR